MSATFARPPYSTATAAGRPVMITRRPTSGARRESSSVTPGEARASRGSETIGASVPSKSNDRTASAGRCTIRSSAAAPASDPGLGKGISGRLVPVGMFAGVVAPGVAGVWDMPSVFGEPVVPPVCVLKLDAQLAGGALAAAVGAQPAEPLDGHRVEGERFGAVDQPVEQLVVAGGGEAELLADGLFLGAFQFPPLAFEGQDALLRVGRA